MKQILWMVGCMAYGMSSIDSISAKFNSSAISAVQTLLNTSNVQLHSTFEPQMKQILWMTLMYGVGNEFYCFYFCEIQFIRYICGSDITHLSCVGI